MHEQASAHRAIGLWRPIVSLAAAGVAITATATAATALPVPAEPVLRALRGATIAATGVGVLFASAWLSRRALVRAGIPADQPMVSSALPAPVQAFAAHLRRSRSSAVAAGLLLGLLLGGLGAGLEVPSLGGRLGDPTAVDLASRSGASGKGASSLVPGSKRPGANVAGARADAGSSEDPDGAGAGGPADPVSDPKDPGRDPGPNPTPTTTPSTPTTTKPRPTFVCSVLDEYPGDIDAVLAGLGLSRDSITRTVCEQIDDLLDDPKLDGDDLLDEILDLLDDLPVPVTTTITVPKVTTTTITVPKVTTTTITVPKVTTTTVPVVTTTTVTLPQLPIPGL